MRAVIRADKPIRRVEDDALARAKSARTFAEQVLSLDLSEGAVAGVLGPWGAGKTSFINLARPHLENGAAGMVDFNPWLFSGAAQLADKFFAQVSAKLRRRHLTGLGREFERYAEVLSEITWAPVVGPWAERVRVLARALTSLRRRHGEDLDASRRRVEKALRDLKKPLVVVLDDIDRLSSEEICDVFKLVRLTACFPNIVYILAFDRIRVEESLSRRGMPGRDFLAKILQLAVDLPVIPDEVLTKEIIEAIDEVLSPISNPGPFDSHRWPDVLMEIIRPLIKNLRDVRRFAAAVYGTVHDLDGQVALVDVLALEAVRVFLPDVFRQMLGVVDALTTIPSTGPHGDGLEKKWKDDLKRLIEAAGEPAHVVQALVKRLFPAGEQRIGGSPYGIDWGGDWLRERRTAHQVVLTFYLERVAGRSFQAFRSAEQAFALLADRAALDQYLRSLPPAQREDAISSLEHFEGEFDQEHVIPGCVVLLNQLGELPERPRGVFEFDKTVVVGREVLRLLRRLNDAQAIAAAVRDMLPQLTTLFAKEQLINIVGHRENVGHKLVPEATAAELERNWRAEVRAAPADALAREEDLLRLVLLAQRRCDPGEPPMVMPDAPEVTLSVLRSARSEVRRQSVGSRAVRRLPRLAWDALLEVYGDESVLRDRIERLKAAHPGCDQELIALADRYLGGWRPERLRDE